MTESNIFNPLKNTFKEFLKTAENTGLKSKLSLDNLIGFDDSVNEDLALNIKDSVLNSMVKNIEESKEFIELIKKTERSFKDTAEKYVRNFFRNTSFYTMY